MNGTKDWAPYLIPYLKDKDWIVRWCVAEKLGDIKDPIAIKPLLILLGDNDFHVVKNTINSLAKFGARIIPDTVKLLSHRHVYIRSQAVTVIKKLGYSSAPFLLKEITKHNWAISNRITHLLWEMGKQDSENDLISLLRNSYVQKNAIVLLSLLRSKKSIPYFIQLYTNHHLRRVIFYGIKLMGKRSAFPIIVQALNNSILKANAEIMILKIGPAILPFLVNAIHEKNPNKDKLFEIIKKIGPEHAHSQITHLSQNNPDVKKLQLKINNTIQENSVKPTKKKSFFSRLFN